MGQQSHSPTDFLREGSIVVNLVGNYSPNHGPRDKCTTEAWNIASPANKLGLHASQAFAMECGTTPQWTSRRPGGWEGA